MSSRFRGDDRNWNQGTSSEPGRSRSNRHRLVRRHPRGDALALRAGGQAAHLRNPPGSLGRGQGADLARERDARLPGHRQEREHFGGLCLHHAGAEPLPDHARLPQSRQARAVGKADRHGAVGGGRADHARQARPAQIHHRLFAAVQSQVRPRQKEDHRRHARQGGLGDGEPAFEPRAGHQDRKTGEAVAGRDGVHPRSGLRLLAARARQAGARLLARRLRLHAADQRLLRRHVVDRHHGRRHDGDHRRRLEPAAGLSQFLLDLGRDHRHRGRAHPRRHSPRRLAQYGGGGHALSHVDHAGRAGGPRVRGPDGTRNHPLPRGLHHGPAGDGDAGKRAPGDGDLHRRRSFRRAQRACRVAAVERRAFRGRGNGGRQTMRRQAKSVGLAIIGAGRVGLFRGDVAARHPAVQWIGIAEKNHNRGLYVAEKIGADFVTHDHRELLKRSEVTCAIIATDEHLHVDPIMAAVERGVPMLIEKPLATDLGESARVLEAITAARLDAVVGYTQRFRRKWLAAKEKVRTGALGDVTLVTSRAFMNRLVAIDNYKRTNDPKAISPMVISGTHALDIVMWCMEAKTPVECYARSIDKVLGPAYQGIDATAGMIMFSDGSVYHLNISWALPVTWPGAVYSLEIGMTGTEGVLTIDDTHRDMVLAVSAPQNEGYAPDERRLVDFMGSYPPGDMVLGELRGPMRDETESWLNRMALGLPTQAATAAEAHNRLMLTKALDLSAKRKQPVKLDEFQAIQ